MAANKRKGILFILTSAFFFSLMTVFVRLSGDVPTMQKAFFRNIVAAILAAILLVRSKEGFSFQKKNLPDLFLRSSIGTAGILCNFWAVDHMNIADANILNKLSPFFAILMSIFILKEKPNRVEWLSVLLAFIGAAFVAKPGAGIASFPALIAILLIAILGGYTAGTAYTYVRKLGLAGERGPVIVMFFSAFSTIVLLPNLLLNYRPMTLQQLLFLVLAGCSAACAQAGRLCGNLWSPPVRRSAGCVELCGLFHHYRDCVLEVVFADAEKVSKTFQGSHREPQRRVRVACKATSSFPHACASFISEGNFPLEIKSPANPAGFYFALKVNI